MARTTLEAWLPEEYESSVITLIGANSAVESTARKVSMGSDTKNIPRSSGIQVEVIAKGGVYGEDGGAVDGITLFARKFGKVIRLAEEDIDDSVAGIIEVKKVDWATSYAKTFDNACLGVTAAENGTTVPFTSVYKALSTTNAVSGYTANANIIVTVTATPVSYDNLSALVGKYEASDYFDQAKGVVIAHPSLKLAIRAIKDTAGNPIFVASPINGQPDLLFGYAVKWSLGARKHAVASGAPTGSALAIIGNADFLIVGTRSGPESVIIDGRSGASALTDETLLKIRARRGFGIGHEKAFAILEVTP